MTSSQQIIYTNFLEASKINDPKAGTRIYTLGPYGARVSFAYQQSRAFALAAGFEEWFDEHHPGEDKGEVKIAILGGGVGGVTLTAALHALGFTCLSLFERKADVLMDQAFASHRLIHPGFNNWPLLNEFSSTTRFPFLNWFAGPCNRVIAALKHEWDRDWKGRLDGAVKTGCIVTDAAFNDEKKCVEVSFREYGHTDAKVANFDHVFIALGFGEEKSTALSSKSAGRYWNIDTVPEIAIDHEYERLLCVGDGDGALIDCARLAFRRDIFRVAAQLMAKLSSDAGRSSDTRNWCRQRTDLENRITEAEIAARNMRSEEEAIMALGVVYLDLVKDRGAPINTILNAALAPQGGLFRNRQIHLVGKSDWPFRPGTAPINKLIMAFLIQNNIVKYHKGSLLGNGESEPFRLDVHDSCPRFNEFHYRIVRVGTTPPVESFFASVRAEKNQNLFKRVNEFPPEAIDAERFLRRFDLVEQLAHRPGTTENVRLRAKQIRQFILTYCRNSDNTPSAGPMFAACSSGTAGRTQIVVTEQWMLASAAARLGGFDFNLFGIPLVTDELTRQTDRDIASINPSFFGRP